MSIIIDNKFQIGQIVYEKSDKDQNPGMVLGFYVTEHETQYEVRFNKSRYYFSAYELSIEKDTLISMKS